MRYVRIFLLTLQQVFEERAQTFVWFLLSCVNPFLMILFWKGTSLSSATLSLISSYYFFLIIGGSFIMSHSEESVAIQDIQEGRLSNYLLKPFGYFVFIWLGELPYRFLQGFFGVVIVTLFIFFLHIHVVIDLNLFNILMTILIVVAAIVLSQIFKMCLGFITFWTTDAYGVFQFAEMLGFIFAGYIVPLSFYPHTISLIAYLLPFAYMIYFPVAAFSGFFTTLQLLLILLGQIAWIIILALSYKILWINGIKQFTGVGS